MALLDFLKEKEFEEINRLKQQLEKYRAIIDIESEIDKKHEELLQIKQAIVALKNDYQSTLQLNEQLKKEVNIFESKLDIIEYGIYEPVYDFERSDDYRAEQGRVIELQKQMISAGMAATCKTNWTIDGSLAKGKASTNRYIKLTLRAFNGECDSLITKVKWNNVNQIKERIYKSFETINKIGESQTVTIQPKYLDLKIKELILEHEYQLKKQQEKEEQRAAQEAIREEEKAVREFEQVQRQAEKEEANYQTALDKARQEMELAVGDKYDKLQAKILQLQEELRMAQEKKERAISMAQQTKRGYVYVISNIGSFGEDVYKIGMTRRLEPTDRVRELGDASVPFDFDIHAMIFSENAPTLERELHKIFEKRKVNMLNYRKEFFKVSINDIEKSIKMVGLDYEFKKIPEAAEYRETIAIIEKLKTQI